MICGKFGPKPNTANSPLPGESASDWLERQLVMLEKQNQRGEFDDDRVSSAFMDGYRKAVFVARFWDEWQAKRKRKR